MKKIYTSYYAKSKKIPPEHVQVAISVSVPHWWQPANKSEEKRLAPDKSWMRQPGWRTRFRNKMDTLLKCGVLQKIADSLPDGAVLMCFEKDPDQCHRQIALNYLVEYCGIEGGEFLTVEERTLFE